jgi:hypothetical protein
MMYFHFYLFQDNFVVCSSSCKYCTTLSYMRNSVRSSYCGNTFLFIQPAAQDCVLKVMCVRAQELETSNLNNHHKQKYLLNRSPDFSARASKTTAKSIDMDIISV